MARGRRSDHSRDEIAELIAAEGAQTIAADGLGAVSARELARRIGYSVSTVLTVMGSTEAIVTAINTRTFSIWADALEERLARNPDDRIAALVGAYFEFAERNRLLWMAIFEHKPILAGIPEDQAAVRARLTGIVVDEVRRALPEDARDHAPALARSLIATVHGHCYYALTGSFALMGEDDPRGAALDRVRESIAAAAGRTR